MELKKYIGLFESYSSMVKCKNCGNEFDMLSVPESGMGYVKCPKCGGPVTQDDLIKEELRYSSHHSRRISFTNENVMFRFTLNNPKLIDLEVIQNNESAEMGYDAYTSTIKDFEVETLAKSFSEVLADGIKSSIIRVDKGILYIGNTTIGYEPNFAFRKSPGRKEYRVEINITPEDKRDFGIILREFIDTGEVKMI